MILLPIIILSIVQGITEFLPISSSGHLVLVHQFFEDIENLNDLDQKRLDIAVHIGTLLAVIGYFRHDFMELCIGGIDILKCRFNTQNAIKSRLIIIASIPIIIAGSVLFRFDMTFFDTIECIAWMSIIFGVILYISDKNMETSTPVESFTFKHACLYGLAQCIALIPGVSRSGITMTAGRFLGHSRTQAARMSMMMGMITIAAAGTLIGFSAFQDATITTEFFKIAGIGIIMSFITAYIAIFIMMKWFAGKGNMTPFVVYRVVLGGILLGLIYSGVITENM